MAKNKELKNKELKDKFKNYLVDKGKSTEDLQDCVDYFHLEMFDVFLFGFKRYKKEPTGYLELFSSDVLPGLRYLKDDNSGNRYFKDKIYKKIKYLFFSFMDFCGDKETDGYVEKILFNDEKEKIERLLEGNYGMFEKKLFIKNWHDFIRDDKGENGDKFRKYLSDIYLELSTKQIKQLYELFFKAYEKCSKINYKNKKRKKGEKINAFDAVFPELSDDLSKKNVRGNSLEKIKSIFGKYLNFVPIYRDRIKEILDDDATISEGSDIQDKTKERIIDSIRDPNGANKERIIDSIRDPNGANYDIRDDGEVVAPLDNYGIFPDSDNTSNGKDEAEEKVETTDVKNTNEKGDSEKIETTEPDPNQDKLYKFDPDEENWWNR